MKKEKQTLVYCEMRKEIQQKILSALAVADKEFKDVSYKKLSAQIKFDYGIGNLTIVRIVNNLVELGMLQIEGDLIQSVIGAKQKLAKKGTPGAQNES